MEKYSGVGYHQHPYWMPPNNQSLFGFHSEIVRSNPKPVCEIPHSLEETTSMFPLSGFQNLNANNSEDWLYNDTLRYHNPFPPLFYPAPIQNIPEFDFVRKTFSPMVSTPPEKKFLVFDQSLAKRTMYNSNAQFGAVRSIDDYEATEEKEDEMHENTEELDALLYSDDEYDDEEEEEKSTGHSPSTITNNGPRGPVEETWEEEEVDSFAGRPTTKRQRILHEPTLLGDEEAESVYTGIDNRCNKRARRDKIHETLRVLRGLIPDTEGKDGVVVINEAVDYLRSLKVKAMALGLDAL